MSKVYDKIFEGILKVINWILIVMFELLTLAGLIGTTIMNYHANFLREFAYFRSTNTLVILVSLIVVINVFVLFDIFYGIEKINTKILNRVAIVYVIVLGIGWIILSNAYPMADQSVVKGIARQFIQGDYTRLNKGEYLCMYPYQLGIVFFFEILFRFTGTTDYHVIMVMNALLVGVCVQLIYCILKKITQSKKVHNFYWIMVFGCFPFIFYSFFVYGTVLGLTFSLAGIYNFLQFRDREKPKYFILGFIFLSLGLIAKSNYKIFAIGVILVFLYWVMRERKFKYVVLAAILTLSLMTPKLITAYYEVRSGKDIGKGTPATVFIAMGMQKTDINQFGCGAAGWYNGYNALTFEEADYNSEEAAKIGRQEIENRLAYFKKNPAKCAEFYGEKVLTQWEEPTFQTFWMVDAFENYEWRSPLADSIIAGNINIILKAIMKIYMLLIWLGNFIYYFAKRKELNVWNITPGVIALGGMMFHILWEAKSLYIIPYFMISMIAGVQGLMIIIEKLRTFYVRKAKDKAEQK